MHEIINMVLFCYLSLLVKVSLKLNEKNLRHIMFLN